MSGYNLFKPSEELTDKLVTAISSGRISEEEAHALAKLDCIEGYVASKGNIFNDAGEYLGKHLMRTVYTLSYMKGTYNGNELRVGENGNFTEEFSFSLLCVIPVPKDSRQLFSDLYEEFQLYVENNEPQQERWDRLTIDRLGVLVTDIPPVVRVTATKPKAKLVGGIGFKEK